MPTQDRRESAWRELAVLWAARRCGALDVLATSAGTPSDVAAETGIEETAAERLVAALHAEGFLAEMGEEYEPTNRLLGFLTKTDLRSIGRLPAELDAFERWMALPETMAGEPTPKLPDAIRNELGSERAVADARVRSEVTTAVHAAPDGRAVVVVGDAAGLRSIEFAERGWDVTVQDTPERIEAVEPLLSHQPIELRASAPVDITECDLVVGVGTLGNHDVETARNLVGSAREAADTAVFLDTFRGETPDAALVDIDRLAAGNGTVHEGDSVRRWLKESFDTAAIESVPASPLSAAIGRVVD